MARKTSKRDKRGEEIKKEEKKKKKKEKRKKGGITTVGRKKWNEGKITILATCRVELFLNFILYLVGR